MGELVEPAQSVGGCEARDGDLRWRRGSGCNCQSFISRNRVARKRRVDVSYHAAETYPDGIDESWIEDVGVLRASHLPAGKDLMDGIPDRIRLLLRSGVEEITERNIIVFHRLVLHS